MLDLVGGIAGGTIEQERKELGLNYGNLEKTGIHVGHLGDAGQLIDDKAKNAYRRRLSELREELDEAKALGRGEQADQLEQEFDALTRELSRAVALRGRHRHAGSTSERARQMITKAIRAATNRIARNHSTLEKVFSCCIKTGTFCSYQPDPGLPISWEFAATSVVPSGQPRSGTKAAPGPCLSMPTPRAVMSNLTFAITQSTPFVGRAKESDALRVAIDGALNGRGSLLMLGGEPGVGKTRLAIEMAESARRNGFACFLGRCYEREDPLPCLPFIQAIEAMVTEAPSLDGFRRQVGSNLAELAQLVPSLRRVFPDVPEPIELPAPQKRRYIFQSVSEALGRAARNYPHLLILDDLHWADEFTLELLTNLANRLPQLPLVIIGTYRDEHSEDNPALARTLEEMIRQGVRPLKLNGLSKHSVEQMLDELSQRRIPGGLVNAIFEQSNGNPFFVEELYRHLIEEGGVLDSSDQLRADVAIDEIDVPENVRFIIARRMRRFSATEMRVLSTAAVVGRSFGFQVLVAVSQTDTDHVFTVIEKAQRMGIIVSSCEGSEKPFAFAHGLVRQTLLSRLSVPRQQELHARIAAAVERLYPEAVKEYAREIAEHLLKAGNFADREARIRWLIHERAQHFDQN